MTKEYKDFLAHYGVKGQRHGVRRYQNEDGTLTPEGRAHYGVNERQPGAGAVPSQEARTTNRTPIDGQKKRRLTTGMVIGGVAALTLGAIAGTTALRNRVRAKEAARFLKTVSYRPVSSSVNSNALGRVFKSAYGKGYHGRLFNEQSQRYMNAGLNRINNINRRQAIGYVARSAKDKAGDFFKRRFRR